MKHFLEISKSIRVESLKETQFSSFETMARRLTILYPIYSFYRTAKMSRRATLARTHACTHNTRMEGERRDGEFGTNIAATGQPRSSRSCARKRAAANATAFVFTGAAGGLPMRHVGLPQLAVFVRPLF